MLLLADGRAGAAGDVPARAAAASCRSSRDEATNFPSDVEQMSFAVAIVLLLSYFAGPVVLAEDPPRRLQPGHRGRGRAEHAWSIRKSVGAAGRRRRRRRRDVGDPRRLDRGGLRGHRPVAVLRLADHRRDRRQRGRALGRGLLRRARQDGHRDRDRDRLERPDRAVRDARAGAAELRDRPVPALAGVQRAGDRRDPARGADRRARVAGRRVDVVRGRAAARGLRRARRSSSTSSSNSSVGPGSGSSSSSSSGSSSSGSSRAEERARRVSKASTSSSRLCSSIAGSSPSRIHSAPLLLVLDQLEVDMGGVVDDEDDLGLWVEVGARTGEELVDVEAAQGRHGREATRPDRKGAVRPRPRRPAAAARGRSGARCGTPRRRGPRPRARRRGRPRAPRASSGGRPCAARRALAPPAAGRSPRRGSDRSSTRESSPSNVMSGAADVVVGAAAQQQPSRRRPARRRPPRRRSRSAAHPARPSIVPFAARAGTIEPC